jgi:DNA-binding transcriptional ArsR family regulator
MSAEDRQDRVFKALADRRRRAMLDLLRDEPRTTGALCEHFPELDRCTVMQHLKVLEKAELVLVRREGRVRWNYLNPLPLQELHERWIRRHATGAVRLLARMKRDLEGG